MKGFIYKLQRTLAKNSSLVKLLIKLRNQCNIIIGLSLAPDHIFESTGEAVFLKSLEGKIKLFFDIGANMGEWTEEMLKLNPAARGFLLEPNPDCISTLSTKFANNNNIRLITAACSDKPGRAAFFAEKGGGETSSLSGAGTYGARKIEVEVTTVDEIVSANQLTDIGYLKIDVEGFDLHVLKGAKNALEKGLIDVIQFEYNKTWRQNGSTLAYAFAFLEEFGYKTYCLKKSGLTAFDVNSYMEYFAYSNFVSLKHPSS
jgi:FkbM family methyltransferase